MSEATDDGMQVMSVRTQEWKSIKLHGGVAHQGGPKRKENVKLEKTKMSSSKNVTGVDTMPTSHKKNVQPRMNHTISARIAE